MHPFNDGNGRTSQLLMNYAQQYYGQSLTIVFSDDWQAYFVALEQCQAANTPGPFFHFMRGQQGKSLAYHLIVPS